MMGAVGGSSVNNTSDAANLATGASALSALASLLQVVSDPAAAKAMLKELNSKSVEIQALLDQVKAQYQNIETMHKEVYTKQVKVDADLKELDAKEGNLRAREADVANKLDSISSREDSFLKAKQGFDQLKKQKEAEHGQRELALVKAENDNATKLSTMLADAERNFAARKSALEAEFNSLKNEYASKVASAAEKDKAAAEALVIAEAKKKLYEGRMASLKQLMQEG